MSDKKLPMLPMFPDSFIGATTGWSLDEVGLYFNLLCSQWLQGGLPNDVEQLPLFGRCTRESFARAWGRVGKKFEPDSVGLLWNMRLEEHRAKSLKIKNVRSEAGKTGGKNKAKSVANNKANGHANSRILSPTPNLDLEPTPSPGKISTPTESHSRPEREDVLKVFKHWQVTFHKTRSALDDKRRRIITNALKLYPEATLCQAITGVTHSPHHMGLNDRNTKYIDIEHCIGSAKRVDHGLECYNNPPQNLTTKQLASRETAASWRPPELRNADK